MSEPENFLSRWSRRKRVGEAPEKPAVEGVPAAPAQAGQAEAKQPAAPTAPPAPVFDPASLPSIDSIGAQTDISAFLKPGVPSGLRNAALRRAWSADPTIRDFKGLAENDWDFNDPNGMMGFGKLDPGTDVKKMLAQLFGETPRESDPPVEAPAQAGQLPSSSPEMGVPAEPAALEASAPSTEDLQNSGVQPTGIPEGDEIEQREKNIAVQNKNEEPDDAQIKRRPSQGSALPQ
jgi:uncharacterized protein DUF3306